MIKNRIVIDGIDKTGKDLLLQYITRLSNHKYVIQARGLLSQVAYSKIFERDYTYDLDIYKHDIIFYLTAENDDLNVRFSINNEPKIDIDYHKKVFDEAADVLMNAGIKVIKINTSISTPYETAKYIIKIMEELNNV